MVKAINVGELIEFLKTLPKDMLLAYSIEKGDYLWYSLPEVGIVGQDIHPEYHHNGSKEDIDILYEKKASVLIM